MILKRLRLHNFGVYRGRHTADLEPSSRQKPVVLVGGLNGGGKTTFLDGLQLALFGRMAHCHNRGELGYEEFLRRSVSRGVDAHDGAGVEVELSHIIEGKIQDLHVRRTWSVRDKHARERLEVCVNGELDTILGDAWAEHVEELIPVRLSRFFFFDGENIETLADLERSAEALRTAIHALLGLDLVDQLVTDLLVIERRKRTEQRSTTDQQAVEAAEREVLRLRARRDELVQERAAANDAVELARKQFKEAEDRFRLGGGDALAQRKDVEAEHKQAKDAIERIEDALRAEAEGVLPLLLVQDRIERIAAADESERARGEARILADLLAARDARTLAVAEGAGASRKVVAALAELLAADRKQRDAGSEAPAYLLMSTEARTALAGVRASLAGEAQVRIHRLLAQADAVIERIAALDRRLASAPEADAIADLATRRQEAKDALATAEHTLRLVEEEHARILREHEHKSDIWQRLADKAAEDQIEEQAATRVLVHSERARQTMKRSRQSILDRRVKSIEDLVLEGFQRLLRKESLISGLSIDPKTFAMTLYGADKRALSPERLSAGERQLLAVSIIWALARASGRPLPVVIDTPLGRLDSIHRDRLVERYFPFASHQVILLSTDKEIDRAHYQQLKPFIGHEYTLRHDDKKGSTSIEQGYFF